MSPHLVRAWSAYKHMRIRSFITHTHTHMHTQKLTTQNKGKKCDLVCYTFSFLMYTYDQFMFSIS